MARDNVISRENCLAAVTYDKDTGLLYWRNRAEMPKWWNARYAGKQAFTSVDTDGYFQGTMGGKPVRAQYVVWAIHNGIEFPPTIDHKNRIRTDNRIENLRAATHNENAANRSVSQGRILGVHETKEGNWRARSRRFGTLYNLGTFKTPEEAKRAYMEFTATGAHNSRDDPGNTTQQ